MLSGISYVQKNKMLLPLFAVGLLLCWFLAFNKTYDAVVLNYKLSNESETANDISFNPAYVERQLVALDLILKGYKVGEAWNDELWMQSSAIATKLGVSVDFTLNKPSAEADSTAVGQSQSLYFYGRYVQLVKLIDTLEGLPGIGKVSALQVKGPKAGLGSEREGKCELRVDFKAI